MLLLLLLPAMKQLVPMWVPSRVAAAAGSIRHFPVVNDLLDLYRLLLPSTFLNLQQLLPGHQLACSHRGSGSSGSGSSSSRSSRCQHSDTGQLRWQALGLLLPLLLLLPELPSQEGCVAGRELVGALLLLLLLGWLLVPWVTHHPVMAMDRALVAMGQSPQHCCQGLTTQG